VYLVVLGKWLRREKENARLDGNPWSLNPAHLNPPTTPLLLLILLQVSSFQRFTIMISVELSAPPISSLPFSSLSQFTPHINPSLLPTAALPVPTPSIPNRIYVGSLHYEIKEADIRMLFSSFGTIKSVEMSFEPATGQQSISLHYPTLLTSGAREK
jgi:hypothetical protein